MSIGKFLESLFSWPTAEPGWIKDDAEAVLSDWEVVGDDLRGVIGG